MKIEESFRDKNVQRVGRGSIRGKTSGRGHKGQKARAGHCIRPAFRDFVEKIPKLRGHNKNRAKSIIATKQKIIGVSLTTLDRYFDNGDCIKPKTFVDKGLMSKDKGRNPKIKILSKGDITKKIIIYGCDVSSAAKEKILAAAGKIM